MSGIRNSMEIPDTAGFQKLRSTTGWNMHSDQLIAQALQQSLFGVSAFDNTQLVGCGRLVGDGILYLYLQDIMVLPEYKGKGIGSEITRHLMHHVQQIAPPKAFIGLMAAEGVADFYRKFGFETRPANGPGMFQILIPSTNS